MKQLLMYCWEKIKRPIIQFVCILVLVSGYWAYDIMIAEHQQLPVIQVMEQPIDSVNVEEIARSEEFYQRFVLPDTIDITTERSPSSIEIDKPVEDMNDREFWLVVVDTVLGHLSSIVGSVAAFMVPVFTWLNNKRKNNNNE